MKLLHAAARTAAAALALTTLATSGAVASGASPASPVATAIESTLEAELVAAGPAVTSPTAGLSTSVRVTNNATTAQEGVFLTVSVTEEPLADLAALDSFLANPESVAVREVARTPTPPEPAESSEPDSTDDEADPVASPEPTVPAGARIAPGGSRLLSAFAPPSALELPDDDWGVYGISINVETEAGSSVVSAISTTWTAADVPELPIAVLTTATGVPARVSAVLRAAADLGAATIVDPSATTNAQVFESGLTSLELFRVPAQNPDITSVAHAGDSTLLPFALSRPAGTSLVNSGDLPFVARVAAVDQSTAEAARAHDATAVLPTEDAAGTARARGLAGTSAVASIATEAGAVPLLLTHEELTARLEATRENSPAARSSLIAASALVADERDSAPVLIAPGASWVTDGAGIAALDSLLTTPWSSQISVTELMNQADAQTIELPRVVDEGADLPASAVEQLADDLADIATLADATDSPEAALDSWGSPLLSGLALERRAVPADRTILVAQSLADADDVLTALRVAEGSEVNLLAESGDVPVTVVNDLDRAANVTVSLTSFSPNLLVLETPMVTVPANEQVTVPISVEAVSTANVTVSVTLRSEDGDVLAPVQQFQMRIRADWGNVAAVIFTVLLALMMVAGIIRTIRRGRKDTRGVPRPAPPAVKDNGEPLEDDEPSGELDTTASAANNATSDQEAATEKSRDD